MYFFIEPFTVDVRTWERSDQSDLRGSAGGAGIQKATTRRSKVHKVYQLWFEYWFDNLTLFSNQVPSDSYQTRGRGLHQSQIRGPALCAPAHRRGAARQSGFSEQTGEEAEQQLGASAPEASAAHAETPTRSVRSVERFTFTLRPEGLFTVTFHS